MKISFNIWVMLSFVLGFAINISLYFLVPKEIASKYIELGYLSFISGVVYAVVIAVKVIPKVEGIEVFFENLMSDDDGKPFIAAMAIIFLIFQSAFIPFSFIGNLCWLLTTVYILHKPNQENRSCN